MSFVLRYTETPSEDLERGTSVHFSDFADGEVELSNLASMFGCSESDIEIVNGLYCQVLPGLCGFKLEVDTLEEAIEVASEFESGSYSSQTHEKWTIFKGAIIDSVPDGQLFVPQEILYVKPLSK